MDDLIEGLLGIAPDSALGALRRRRPEALKHAQGAYRELLLPEDPGNVSHEERAALALRVALREGDAALAGHFHALMKDAAAIEAAGDLSGAPRPGRLGALLAYADTVAARPEAVDQAAIDALGAMGLTARDIVAITQLVSFVPYQVRVMAGLRAMMAEAAA